ncbi:hypothetical protein DMC47_34215 [Nostoc sp. 3335mG]|nr:hypothetical protein DMC47_34215 [Nostoc sp. 3335mG]
MSLQAFTPQAEYEHCIERERIERSAARTATSPGAVDRHIMMAERYADQAWSLAEAHDLAYVPSGLWSFAAQPTHEL